MIVLLDDFERNQLSSADLTEKEFEFLNRSARWDASYAREQTEGMIAECPEAGLPHLRDEDDPRMTQMSTGRSLGFQ